MIEWATTYGKPGCTTEKCKARDGAHHVQGTLPLNMYRTSDYPKDKVSFRSNTVVEQPATSATTHTRPLKMIK